MNPSQLRDLPKEEREELLMSLAQTEQYAIGLITGLEYGIESSNEEAARILGFSPERVNAIIARAMRKLEKRIKRSKSGKRKTS